MRDKSESQINASRVRLIRHARALLDGFEGKGHTVQQCLVAVSARGHEYVLLPGAAQAVIDAIREMYGSTPALTHDSAEYVNGMKFNRWDERSFDPPRPDRVVITRPVLGNTRYGWADDYAYAWVRYITTEVVSK